MAVVNEIVAHRKTRQTGATISLERTGEGSWIDQDEGWATLCMTHLTVCIHPTRKLAERHMVYPGWCGDCQRIMNGEMPKISGGKVI